MPEIGQQGQAQLNAARVLCIGAGGLGSGSLPYLAGAGIGHITIIDPDIVSLDNLHRQTLYGEKDIGQYKTDIAKAHLTSLNSNIKIVAHPFELTAENALELFNSHDIILDGSDNFTTRFLANDAAVKCGKPLISAAIQGYEGQIATYYAAKGACYRCLYPTPPKAQIQNCADAGVLGPAVGILGAAQATEALKLIINNPNLPNLIGKIWIFDLRYNETRTLKLKKSLSCPTCSINPKDIRLKDMPKSCNIVKIIEPHQIEALENPHFIDVREQHEWEHNHIKDAEHLPLSKLMQDETLIPTTKADNYILYCHMGARSEAACILLEQRGIKNTHNLIGGFDSWLESL